jgi:DNA primase
LDSGYTDGAGATTANVFEALRREVQIQEVVSRVTTVEYEKARCVAPGHFDATPSMHLYEERVHCFSCGFHGDVVDVWAAMHSFDRPIEAAWDLAREYDIELPEWDPEAERKAEERRKHEAENMQEAEEHHKHLERHPHIRDWWRSRGFDEELQKRYLLGASTDGRAATIPFWYRGRVQGIIRRNLEGEPKYIVPEAKEIPGAHKPLFIPAPLKRETFLVEGYIDALAITATGRSAIAVGGTDISDTQNADLRRVVSKDTMIFILPDNDVSGAEAARRWGTKLFPQARVAEPSYGEGAKDIADVFVRDGSKQTAEQLDRLMSSSQDMIDIEMEIAKEIGDVRERLTYVAKNIAPLLAPIHPEGLRDATADIVADTTKLKKNWISKAIKDEQERLVGEQIAALDRVREEEFRRRVEEYRQQVAEAQPEIDELLAPGVLPRLRDAAARMHQVYGDREPLELTLLVALGAQLEPLPNGRPLGASILLTAPAGRGKNHIVDAAVTPLPEEFYFAFEIASGQSLYYKADEDPEFLKHTFAYPNEIEGAESLWEFLRPMLSKGSAKKVVTAKDAAGNMTTRTIIVEGPVTIAIPTIRNKTDGQLQTRLLVAEMPDYVGRVKHHSAAVSKLLLPDAATADHSREKWLWQQGLRQLTGVRRVVFPLRHPDFALDDDQVSHGARLWANLLSLMATHAWLEQKNRRLLDLGEDKLAIEATPGDYAVAYHVFIRVCKRTVVNLSDTHRKILNAVHALHKDHSDREGFTQREISTGAGVSLSTVSDNKKFLVTSAKLLKETGGGLALVEGADPSWWATAEMMKGLPSPEQVRSWWERGGPPPEGAEHDEHDTSAGRNTHNYPANGVRHPAEQEPNAFGNTKGEHDEGAEPTEHVRQMFGEEPNSENGVGKRETGDREGVFDVFGSSGDDPGMEI